MKRNAALLAEGDTQQRILLAARQVFARRGFDAGTVREITELAQVNTAAVNYYFRSKDELIRTVFEQGLKPIIQARTGALDACLTKYRPGLPPLEAVAEALVRPLVELSSGEYRDVMMLLTHVRTGMILLTKQIVEEQFRPVHEHFVDILQRLLPDLSRSEIALRYDCARGATLQTLVQLAPAAELVSGAASATPPDSDTTVRRLVRFVTAGFQAPPA